MTCRSPHFILGEIESGMTEILNWQCLAKDLWEIPILIIMHRLTTVGNKQPEVQKQGGTIWNVQALL